MGVSGRVLSLYVVYVFNTPEWGQLYYSCETKIPLSQSEDLIGVTKLFMIVKVVVSWIVHI